ncbi:MAG: hypothetical protein U0931_34860 [Vulcanimicrobiota bacterium]
MRTVSALFDTLEQARYCIADLNRAGFDRRDVNLISNAGESELAARFNEAGQMHDVTESVTEAVTALGGLGGLVVGLSLFFVPGVGPVLAAGGLPRNWRLSARACGRPPASCLDQGWTASAANNRP